MMKKLLMMVIAIGFTTVSAQEIVDHETEKAQEAIGAAENASDDVGDVAADLDNSNDNLVGRKVVNEDVAANELGSEDANEE